MTIEAKIIEDSIGPRGQRLTTMQLVYPRFIHSELMTHRQFSRNASSSRAIPTDKFIKQIRENPGTPNHWGANQPGMQAGSQIPPELQEEAKIWWKTCANAACDQAELAVRKFGLHKQVVNRILEPFQHMNTIVTSSEWANFFALRVHADAEPNIQELAKRMRIALENSIPDVLDTDEWHLPYITTDEIDLTLDVEDLLKMSAARCARVSYMNHDGSTPTREADLKLYDQLMGGFPVHASPVEHQACPDGWAPISHQWIYPHLHGNFIGWIQYRKTIEGECVQ